MFAFPDQFVALQRQSLESAQAIAFASFAGFEKFSQLNVQAAKASVEEGVRNGRQKGNRTNIGKAAATGRV